MHPLCGANHQLGGAVNQIASNLSEPSADWTHSPVGVIVMFFPATSIPKMSKEIA
jgi:hypothetical protein